MRNSPWVCSSFVVGFVFACAGPVPPDESGDDGSAYQVEGIDVMQGAEHTLRMATPFVRLGVLWDAPAPGAFELRTSVDGLTWSPWTAPVETFAEGVTRAGHVDLAAAAQLISYRVPDPANAPTWLSFEPMDEIPAPLPDEG
jgi:hypothetical protein